MKTNLYVISSEKIYFNNGNFFCDNLDIKSTPEGLSKYFKVNLISKKTSISKKHQINLKFIKIYKNTFAYILNIIKSAKVKNTKYLIISLSPLTFMACIILKFLKKKPYIYLRSNGYEEYKIILGSFGYFVYHLMFIITSRISTLISCRDYILMKKKGFVVSPSQLNKHWYENQKLKKSIKQNLIYVGRIRQEKGIFSLLEIIKNHPEVKLSVVGMDEKTKKINQENVSFFDIINDQQKLISLYDDNDILILPSYTEGYPMVVLEALSRLRPVIIFKEIKHIIEDKKGIFVADRNYDSLIKTINFIKANYYSIQEDMKQNNLPSNESFIKEIKNIILQY
tara:strand:+ start:2160 stop:3176 length:1017 start_codon:yes stop_codon:yes gene_type:complete